VSHDSVLRRAIHHHAENGAIATAGAGAEFLGTGINERCQSVSRLLRADRGRGYPLRTRLRAARHGFSAHTYLWLGLDAGDPTEYLATTTPIRDLNEGYVEPLHNKYAFQLSTRNEVEAVPRLLGTVDRGSFTPAAGTDSDLAPLLAREGRLVLKPMRSGRGEGVAVLAAGDDGARIVTGDDRRSGPVTDLVAGRDDALVTAFVEQAEYAAAIYPATTNTVRIHTLIDPETGAVELLRACHRFGSRASVPTDNWSQGGYLAPVNVESGEIRPLVALDHPPRSRLDCHPETGERVAGVTVPHWNALRTLVRGAARLHRPAPFVGWDVAVTPSGPVLIEANARPSVVGLQLTAGLLTHPLVRTVLGTD